MDGLTYLFSLEQFGIKFGLDNIRALLARLDQPQRAFQSIHIAGTNGKGSVTAMVDAVLRAAGQRSARFTSPHLVDLSERFVIDGRPVDRAAMLRAADEFRRAADAALADGTLAAPPTFFEATTAIAFDLFRRAGADFAVVEVGLGGRLDSTNVIEPIATAITSIDFDHQQYLGNTLAAIAAEKAGIIKPGIPVIVGDIVPEAMAVIERTARELGSELIRSSDATHDYGPIALGLRGAHQQANARVAMRVLEAVERRGIAIGREAIVQGLTQVRWPGRLDVRTLAGGQQLLLDAAHNPAGAAALASYLRALRDEQPLRPVLVFGAMRDKDVDGMLTRLLPELDRVFVTRPSTPRAAEPDELAARIRAIAPALPIDIIVPPAAAVQAAARAARFVVVAGSIFLLGDVLREIGA